MIWQRISKEEIGRELLFTCSCHETMTQLTVDDLEDGLFSITITDRPAPFRRRLWNFLRSGNGSWEEIILKPEDARALASELNKLAERYE